MDNIFPMLHPDLEDKKVNNNWLFGNIARQAAKVIDEANKNGIAINTEALNKIKETMKSEYYDSIILLNEDLFVKEYIHTKATKNLEKRKAEFDKKKTYKDFITEFNPKNHYHLTYVVNRFVKDNNMETFVVDKWTRKMLDKAYAITGYEFFKGVLTIHPDNKYIKDIMKDYAIYKHTKYWESCHLCTTKDFMFVLDPKKKTNFMQFYSYICSITGKKKENKVSLQGILKLIEENTDNKNIVRVLAKMYRLLYLYNIVVALETFSDSIYEDLSADNVSRSFSSLYSFVELYTLKQSSQKNLKALSADKKTADKFKQIIIPKKGKRLHIFSIEYFTENIITTIFCDKELFKEAKLFLDRDTICNLFTFINIAGKISDEHLAIMTGESLGYARELNGMVDTNIYAKIKSFYYNIKTQTSSEAIRKHIGLGYHTVINEETDIEKHRNYMLKFWNILIPMNAYNIMQIIKDNNFDKDVKVVGIFANSIYIETNETFEETGILYREIVEILTKNFFTEQFIKNRVIIEYR